MDPLTGQPLRVFFGYAIPTIVGMLAISSATIIDGLFVGNYVGAPALAAVNLSMPLLNIVFGVSFMFAIGGSVMAGKFLGEKNPGAASATVRTPTSGGRTASSARSRSAAAIAWVVRVEAIIWRA
jgi:Na+-driven multidrug efflux pump